MLRFLAPLFIVAALGVGLVPLIAFAVNNGGAIWPDAYAWRVTRFTLLQATLSTLLSVGPAILVARALARQDFPGRQLILALFAVPLSLPAIVAVFGLTALYGRSGVFSGVYPLYGLGGIVLAHVFFNLPLATRLLFSALQAAPPENHRLAAQLGFAPRDVFRHIDWPVLQPALPRVAALVFLLCASSFVIVLVLGGVEATTLEVAIYQSLRMDFDVSRALALSLIQIILSATLVFFAAQTLRMPETAAALRLQVSRFDGASLRTKLWDGFTITTTVLLVGPVLAAVAAQGALHMDIDGTLRSAFITSVLIAILSVTIAVPLCWGMSLLQGARWSKATSVLGLAGYIVPPAVIATGWFLAFRNFDGGRTLPVILIATMNALMALPFMLAVFAPAFQHKRQQHDQLCAQLGIRGFNRLRLIDLPALRQPLAQAMLMAFVLSLGDLTAVTLLGAQGLVTLPSLVQQQMGHYQSQAAGGTALVLALLCLALTVLSQKLSRP
jgi:thiamine transport system permease protein